MCSTQHAILYGSTGRTDCTVSRWVVLAMRRGYQPKLAPEDAWHMRPPLEWMFKGVPQRRFVKRARRNGITLLVSFLSMACVLLGCRVIVVFSESYSVVSSERRSDESLLELCSAGKAAESARMRNACMGAKADQASPILFKVLSRTAYATINEVYQLLFAPMQSMSLSGYLALVLSIPWYVLWRYWLWSRQAPSPRQAHDTHTVLIMPGRDDGQASRHGLTHRTPRATIEEVEAGYEELPCDALRSQGWSSVSLRDTPRLKSD